MTQLPLARIALACAGLFVWSASARVSAAEIPGLVGHWKLDEGAGVTAIDSSGFGRHGAITGGSYVTNGLAQITPNGSALQLNGSGGRIAIPDSPDWNLTPSTTLTISLWVTLLEDRGIYHVFGKRQGCDGNWFYQLARDHRGFFFMTQGGAVIANRPLAPGWLTHVAVTYDAGQVRLYMDGVLAGSGVAPMTTTPAGPLLFGTSGSCDATQTFPGILDDLRIYRGALSAEQIGELGARQGTVFVPLRPNLTWNVRYVNRILDQMALSATASVSGTFTYSPGLGSVLPTGPATLNVHFEPDDRSRYAPVDLAIQVYVPEVAVPVVRINLSAGRDAGVAVDEIRNLVYIPEREIFSDAGTPVRGQLVVLDGATNAVVDRISLWKDGVEVLALAVAVNMAANRVYVTSDEAAGLWVLDATTRQLIEIVDLPFAHGAGIAVNPTTGFIYLKAPEYPAVMVVNPMVSPNDPGRITLVVVETYGWRVEVNSITNLVYVGGAGGSGGASALAVIDGDPTRATFHTVLGTLPICCESSTFAINRRTGLVYVLGRNGQVEDGGLAHVMIVDGDPSHSTFHTIVEDIAVDLGLVGQGHASNALMTGVAVNPVTNRIYAHIFDFQGSSLDSLTVIDGATHDVVSMAVLPFSNSSLATLSSLVINPVTNRLYIANGRETLILEDAVIERMPTAPGATSTPVVITSNQVTVTFTGVTTAGMTQIGLVAVADLNATVPGGFAIAGAHAYELTTTASVVAPITLCFNAWHVDETGAFAALRVLHGENGALVDRTSSHNFATRTICATVGSLSPFVIARYTEPTYGIVRLDDGAKTHKAGSTVPVRLQVTSPTGVNLSSASLAVHAIDLRLTSTNASFPIVDSGQPNPGQDFRFDAGLGGSGGYIFNLKTTGLATGSYELRFTVGGGHRQYSVPLQIR